MKHPYLVIMEGPEYLWTSHRAYAKLAKEDGEFLHWTTDIKDELPIVMKTSGPASVAPTTTVQLLVDNARTVGAKPALTVLRNKKWVTWTWGEVHRDSLRVAKSLSRLQVPERTCTNIIGFNSPEWFLAFTGSLYANCIPVGVYTTNQTEACFYVANHSEMQVLFAQNETHIKKYFPVLDKLPQVKAIVCDQPSPNFNAFREGRANIFTWDEFLALGDAEPEPLVRMQNQSPGQVCTIVYTSGTTGPPKGVMLSHDNYIFVTKSYMSQVPVVEDESIVSYLPMSHSASQVLDIFTPIVEKILVAFADERALHGTLGDTLRAIRPTRFLGVPRVYEKIEEAIRGIASKTTGLKKPVAAWAKNIGYRASLNQVHGQPPPWGYCLANSLVLSKIKKSLGFDRTHFFLVGAAPFAKSTLEFFLSLNIPIYNVYGMSESSAPTTANFPVRNNIYSVGYPLPGTNLKIVDMKNQPVPAGTRGEICFGGRHKFLGYFKSPKETRETVDSEGYIHSGDEGYVDQNGFLFITGRFKELIITAGGENIPPVLIEDAIKAECKLISNVFLAGEARKHLTALVTLKNVPTGDGEPSDILPPDVVTALQAEDCTVTTVKAAITDQKVRAIVDKAIAAANSKAVSKAQYVHKWMFIPKDFSMAGGELTPTLKLKRKVVNEKYKAEIESLYLRTSKL